MEDIKLTITRGSDQKIYLHAKTMNELVDKIIDFQLWDNQNLGYFKKKGILDEEKESGWYYFVSKQDNIWLDKSMGIVKPLPDFLIRDHNGCILTGCIGGTNVTKEWNDYLNNK